MKRLTIAKTALPFIILAASLCAQGAEKQSLETTAGQINRKIISRIDPSRYPDLSPEEIKGIGFINDLYDYRHKALLHAKAGNCDLAHRMLKVPVQIPVKDFIQLTLGPAGEMVYSYLTASESYAEHAREICQPTTLVKKKEKQPGKKEDPRTPTAPKKGRDLDLTILEKSMP